MNSDNSIFLAEDCVEVEEKMYFISKYMNIIFSLDTIDGKVSMVSCLPEHDAFDSRLGAKILSWRNELIFAPMKAQKIWRYNLETKRWKGYERKAYIDETEMFEAIIYGDTAFIIGSNYPAIIRIDLVSDKMTYIDEPYRFLKEKKIGMNDSYFRTSYARIGSWIFLASCLDNMVLKFDLESLEYKWLEIGSKGNCYSGISWDGEYFWLAPRKGTPLVRWNGENEITEFALPAEVDDRALNFLGVVCMGDEIILPGFTAKYSLIMNKNKGGKFEKIQGQYLFYKEMSNGKVISCSTAGELVIVQKNQVKKFTLACDKKMLVDFIKHNFFQNESVKKRGINVMESEIFGIKTLIELITPVQDK